MGPYESSPTAWNAAAVSKRIDGDDAASFAAASDPLVTLIHDDGGF
jgi:hypothetical protein